MAWSSFAHLPTKKEDYFYILSNIENDMSINEVDKIIADYKNKEKVPHNYRNNLANLGLFRIDKKKIFLNYDKKLLKDNQEELIKILKDIVIKCNKYELNLILDIIKKISSYNVNKIINVIYSNNSNIEYKNLVRWLRPLIKLMEIIDIIGYFKQKNKIYANLLQNAYLNLSNNKFKKNVALELLEKELKKENIDIEMTAMLENISYDPDIKFNILLITMPKWATKYQYYKIKDTFYTDIEIKSNLI